MARESIKEVSIFISIPGDVGPEQSVAKDVINRLDAEFGELVKLKATYWEYEPASFTPDYREDMPRPADFDILICILWSRLGVRPGAIYQLPPPFERQARSGTEYELEDARLRHEKEGVPHIMVWHKRARSKVELSDADLEGKRRQLDQLDDFLAEWTQDEKEKVFKGAINRYEGLADFESSLEAKLRKLIEQRLEKQTAQPRARPRWKGNPYRGLDVFEYEHARIFFGRTDRIANAIVKLRKQITEVWRAIDRDSAEDAQDAGIGGDDRVGKPRAFVLMFGASGSGKSSLARAGILPMLVNGNSIEGVGLWRCAIMKPSKGRGDLMKALASALVQEEGARNDEITDAESLEGPGEKKEVMPKAIPELVADSRSTVDRMAARLNNNPEAAADMVNGALSEAASVFRKEQEHVLRDKIAHYDREGRVQDVALLRRRLAELRQPRACLALLLDQLEEIFTERFAPEEIRRFLHAIDALAADGRVVVIATLRSEFFARCEDYPVLLRLKDGEGTVHLATPGDGELSQMIRKPAQAAGVTFEDNDAEGALNQHILRAASGNPDCLPLLEFCLGKLYEKCKDKGQIDYKTYERLHKLEGVLTYYADEVFHKLLRDSEAAGSPETAESIEASFYHVVDLLATVGEGAEGETGHFDLARRVVRYADLVDRPVVKGLVDAFVEARLFTKNTDTDCQATVSVTHEALLRNWERVRKWYDKEGTRQLIQVRARVDQRLKQWKELTGQDKSQSTDQSYFLQPGRELDDAKEQVERRPRAFTAEAREFMGRSLEAAAEKEFRACIQAGGEEEMVECAKRLEIAYPRARLAVIADVLSNGKAGNRRNAAVLVGLIEPTGELLQALARLAVSDPEDGARRAAAYSIARLDRADLCEEIGGMALAGGEKSEATGALARVLVAADIQVAAPKVDRWFRGQSGALRRRVRLKAWWLRLQMAVPVFFAVVIPATVLAVISAMMFKWLPGIFNYAYGQATPSPVISMFHGATAAIFIGGGSCIGLTFYRMVLGREHGKFDYLRPFGAVVAGALSGAVGGFISTLAIAGIFAPGNLYLMGWIPAPEKPPFWELVDRIFHQPYCGLIYILDGMGLGAGMALITNRMRGCTAWRAFLDAQSTSSLSDLKQAIGLMRGLTRLSLSQAWPLPVALLVTSLGGYLLLHPAPYRKADIFSGGMLKQSESHEMTPEEAEEMNAKFHTRQYAPGPIRDQQKTDVNNLRHEKMDNALREWKTSNYGRIFGLAGDGTAMIISGFFGVLGIGFGIVILRSGISVEARSRNG